MPFNDSARGFKRHVSRQAGCHSPVRESSSSYSSGLRNDTSSQPLKGLKMESLKLEDLQNPITEVVTRLPEIGDPIWLLQHKIDAAAAEIRSLESKIESIRGWNERDKQTLFEMVKRNYTDSEIEAADVMITRLRP